MEIIKHHNIYSAFLSIIISNGMDKCLVQLQSNVICKTEIWDLILHLRLENWIFLSKWVQLQYAIEAFCAQEISINSSIIIFRTKAQNSIPSTTTRMIKPKAWQWISKRNSAVKGLQLINKVRMHTRLISWTANLGSEQMAPQKILIRTEHLTVFSFEIRFGKQLDNDLQT
jgi:hypothetical protein